MQQKFHEKYKGAAAEGVKEKAKAEVEGRTDAHNESEVGHKCGHCGEWAPQVIAKSGMKYFKCKCGYAGFTDKYDPSKINWAEPKPK
jgi:hypothetical protein